jgi:16S rRNA (guanine527-N7)-methyltransferase
LGVALTEMDAARLLKLLDELQHWGRAYNLTAIKTREEGVTHHLLDSLAVNRDLQGGTIADVGTGAGFPGLPLALVNPERRFTLIDSNAKKVRFVTHAARLLALSNVAAVHARVESLQAVAAFDTVIARAFAPLPRMLEKVAALCGPRTRVVAMKGKRPGDELDALPTGWRTEEVRELAVPGLDEARSVVVLAKR